ncbi:MAG: MFS transporter [Clostridia bacterium]|nr:MFS transporter [Clostridia bacterium]
MAKSDRKLRFGVVFAAWFLYTLSICLKMVYSSSMAAVKVEYEASNLITSLPITIHYVLYAGIQFALAYFVTKINIKRYMAINFVVAGVSFISVFFYSPVWYIGFVLALNGITLGPVWCGSILIMTKFFSKSAMKKALLFVTSGFSIGSAMSFGISSLAISLGNWRISFLIVGLAFLVATVYYLYIVTAAEKAGVKPEEESPAVQKETYKPSRVSAKNLLYMSIIATFFGSMLYYGFTHWLPTILLDNFDISTVKATLVSTLFPTVVYIGPILATLLVDKVKDDFKICVVSSIAISVFGLILAFVFKLNIVLTVAVILVLGVLLRLINNLFASLVPIHVKDYVNAGTTSAVLNASACLSAALSPFLISLVLDASGNDWQVLFFVLFGVAIVLLLICGGFTALDIVKRKKAQNARNND